jgi:hypothetical protein
VSTGQIIRSSVSVIGWSSTVSTYLYQIVNSKTCCVFIGVRKEAVLRHYRFSFDSQLHWENCLKHMFLFAGRFRIGGSFMIKLR